MKDQYDKVVNNMNADDADRIRKRIITILNKRRLYGDVLTMYKDSAEFEAAVHDQVYELPEGEEAKGFEGKDKPINADIENGYTSPISDQVRIKDIHGMRIINPLLAICDKGDFTFVVAHELIPNSFDKDEIEPFLDQLESECDPPERLYSAISSCRSACTGICQGTCGNVCDGCSADCDNICTGCGACTGTCSHLCGQGACTATCKGDCLDSCGGTCTGHCFGGCKGGCYLVCYAACGGGCTSGCSHTCKGGVGHVV